jgi:hypothetical protein
MAAPTLDDAILDPSIPMHWMLEIMVEETVVFRCASATVDAGGHCWPGLLTMTRRPHLRVNPYEARGEVCSCSVRLAPMTGELSASVEALRPCDLSALHNRQFSDFRARLWRWVEGSAWPPEASQLLIDGYLSGGKIEPNAALSVDVVDATHRLDREFPIFKLDKRRFPNAHADDLGDGPNYLFGTFRVVPAPVTHVGSYYCHGAAGALATVSNAYLDDGAGGITGESIAATTDALGDSYTRLALGSNNPEDKHVTFSGTGYLDDAGGTYQGTPGALLTHPAAQLYYWSYVFCGIPYAKINRQAILNLRTALPGWVTALQVLGSEKTSWSAKCQEIAQLYRGAWYEERGLITTRNLDFNRPPTVVLVEGRNLLEWGPVDPPSEDMIPAEVRISADWGWKGKKKNRRLDWRDVFVADGATIPEFGAAKARFARPVEIQCKSLADNTTGGLALALQVELRRKPRRGVQCKTDRSTHRTLIFDTADVTAHAYPSLDGEGCAGKRWAVEGIEYGLNGNMLELLEGEPVVNLQQLYDDTVAALSG